MYCAAGSAGVTDTESNVVYYQKIFCELDLSGINDKNYERIINTMSLIIAIMGIYKDLSKEVKILIPLAINICKEKTELLRKNAAILMARYAKAAPENEEYLRQLHGMEVLVSVSGHLKI